MEDIGIVYEKRFTKRLFYVALLIQCPAKFHHHGSSRSGIEAYQEFLVIVGSCVGSLGCDTSCPSDGVFEDSQNMD